MYRKILSLLTLFCLIISVEAQVPQPLKQFINKKEMNGASFSFMVKDIKSGNVLYAYDEERQVIPASVMKLVTTAAALEILGEDYQYETTLEYTGRIEDGILEGDLYIKGSGDPTLGSSHFVPEGTNRESGQHAFLREWIRAVKNAGITKVNGSVIVDESIFDTEGTHMKWVQEDLGSYYGAGSYGISVFDNIYRLYLNTTKSEKMPVIIGTEPEMPDIRFHNYLSIGKVSTDSSYILGFPYSNERFLYGVIPTGKDKYTLRGDIPDPSFFLAQYFRNLLIREGIEVEERPYSYRLLSMTEKKVAAERTILHTTYSPPLEEIVEIINKKSHNLYADALLKTVGLLYTSKNNEVISSFGKGIKIIQEHLEEKGLNISTIYMEDGSGLAITDKLTAEFICDLLFYMANQSEKGLYYKYSLPEVGIEGSVRNFLKGGKLQGKARLKSGSMSRVKGYAGYITSGEEEYAVALLVNNYSGEGRTMTREIEKLLIALF